MMRLVPSTAPLLRATSPFRACNPRADVLDDLKYQLSNADPATRPARDLVENPVATAYLFVLALFGGGLAYLLYLDTQAKARREAALLEQEEAIRMMREQGYEEEAAILQKDLKQERKAPNKKADQPKGLKAPIFAEDDAGNRFERRQGREAKKQRKEKKKKRR